MLNKNSNYDGLASIYVIISLKGRCVDCGYSKFTDIEAQDSPAGRFREEQWKGGY